MSALGKKDDGVLALEAINPNKSLKDDLGPYPW